METDTGGIVLGIDGGGTRTRAVLVDDTGRVLGLGLAGPSNYQAAGIETATENLERAVAGAWSASGRERTRAGAAFLGMAGVVSGEDRAAIETMAATLGLARRVGVDHDIRTALAGGLAGAPGIALIAGTGSSSYGRRADGASWRSGGWGRRIDDPGSGYWLGAQGLAAIARAYDGRGEATSLAAPLMERLGIRSMDALLHLTGDARGAGEEIAALAPLVLRTAVYGDRVARAIAARGADELARMVEGVMLRLMWDGRAPVILAGGLAADPYYCRAIGHALERRAPMAMLVPPMVPPVLGAALLALELAGVTIDPPLITTLSEEKERMGLS